MLAKLQSFTLVGIDAEAVEVEVDIALAATPSIVLVGLAETAVREHASRRAGDHQFWLSQATGSDCDQPRAG